MKRLIVAIIGVLYVAAVATCGIYAATHQTFSLDAQYYTTSEQSDINGEQYEQLIKNKASFVLFVDMAGCITANGLRNMLGEITSEHPVQFLHIMWPEAKSTSLHDSVKYYPSIVIVREGKIVDFLKADSDEHAKYYNSTADLSNWLMHYIKL